VTTGRERLAASTVLALVSASAGLFLLFAGALAADVDRLGLLLGTATAVVYAGYVVTGERVVKGIPPVLLAALVATGAAAAFTVVGSAGGGLDLSIPSSGWRALVLISVAATVVPMLTLYAGIDRLGATRASIVSTVEPVAAVVLAVLFLGERLDVADATGAGLVLGAVMLLRRPSRSDETPQWGGER
jgi:drug/metabolite transporter (DMT)-like permease